jgi:amino acid adenylation domain-containing protein
VRNGLAEICQREEITLFMVLLAALDVLLWRYTGQEDLLVGVPIANRDRKEVEELVGLFVNTLVVRNDLSGDPTVRELLARVRERCLDAYANQDLPVEVLVEHMQPERDLSRNPLFQVMLVLENASHRPTFEAPGLNCSSVEVDRRATHIDWTLYVEESEKDLKGIVEYATDLFDEATIARMAGHWHTILETMATHPERHISELTLLPDDERQQLLVDLNATAREFPREACLQQLIEHQVARVPESTAVVGSGTALSYVELDRQANRFAHALRERGISRGQHVGICVERGTDMLAAVLGILKAGAAYIPLDPSFPEDRLRFMAEDAELALLVSTSDLVDPFGLPREQQLLLDADAAIVGRQSSEPLIPDAELDADSEDPAYLIYTSGSTGKPKGVVVPHRAVVNFLTSMAREPGLTENDVLVAVTTLSFDISVLELYLPLTLGARVVIASRDEAVDGHSLQELLEEHHANVMQATPVTWRLLLEAGWSGGASFKALVGGEALPKDLAEQLIENEVQLWNMYGPTETTVWSTCARITDTAEGITIGTPIDNTTIYILDEHRNLCPVGVPGELYIGGDGVTLGYWKRLELTDDRYLDDPFSTDPGALMYGTGDKARWRNDGTLEQLGRLDDQVKVRGYRVELGEIESLIAEHPDVSAAATRLWIVNADDVRIVACCVPERSGQLATVGLRKSLRSTLPEYMVPQYFLPVDEIPLTPNGKVDRRRLPIPITTESFVDQNEAPSGAVEATIAEIWTELIQPARAIGRNDKFFEMGGHSLLALRALRQMGNQLNADLDFHVLFQENLADIASRIQTPHNEPLVADVSSL